MIVSIFLFPSIWSVGLCVYFCEVCPRLYQSARPLSHPACLSFISVCPINVSQSSCLSARLIFSTIACLSICLLEWSRVSVDGTNSLSPVVHKIRDFSRVEHTNGSYRTRSGTSICQGWRWLQVLESLKSNVNCTRSCTLCTAVLYFAVFIKFSWQSFAALSTSRAAPYLLDANTFLECR